MRELGLYPARNRSLLPPLGCWLSRDPYALAADINALRYSRSRPTFATDPDGLWTKPDRQADKSWASTCAAAGDTWASLAAMLHLDPNEYQRWVHEGTKAPPSPVAGNTYQIPNTVEVYTSEPGGFDSIWVFGSGTMANVFRETAVTAGRNYAAKNYKVNYHTEENSDANFKAYWRTSGIVAFAFGGHGAYDDQTNTWLGYIAATGSDEAVAPDGVRPPYKLQAIGTFFCGSNEQVPALSLPGNIKTMSWANLVSPTGAFVGFNGDVNRLNVGSKVSVIDPGNPNPGDSHTFIPD